MWRVVLRVAVGLAFVHAALTFAMAIALFRAAPKDMLAFAQHGFGFVFLGCLNLATWEVPIRSRRFRWMAHGSNVAFFAFYVTFSVVQPHAPNYVATVILFGTTLAAFALDRSASRDSPGSQVVGTVGFEPTTP